MDYWILDCKTVRKLSTYYVRHLQFLRKVYINRGLENGLGLEALRKELKGKEITIKYPDYWSLPDPGKKLLQISKIERGGKTVYSEIQ